MVNYTLHRFFTPFVMNGLTVLLWDRYQLKQALITGTSHPKYTRAKDLADKISNKEAFIKKMSASELGLIKPSTDGWALTWMGKMFIRSQVAAAVKGTPAQKAMWGTVSMAMWTLLNKTFDAITYVPKKQDPMNLLWKDVVTCLNKARQGGRVEPAVKAVLRKVLRGHDLDGLQTDLRNLGEEASMMFPINQDHYEEVAESWEGLSELADEVSDDEELDGEEIHTQNVAELPDCRAHEILEAYKAYKHEKNEQNLQILEQILLDEVNRSTTYGSDKDYFVLPVVGEFDFEDEDEMLEYMEVRRESIREGYSDSPNYEFHDLDIPTYMDQEEREHEKVQLMDEKAARESIPSDKKEMVKQLYVSFMKDFQLLDGKKHDQTQRDAFYAVVRKTGLNPEGVGKVLASA
jgi:hypothetical protein